MSDDDQTPAEANATGAAMAVVTGLCVNELLGDEALGDLTVQQLSRSQAVDALGVAVGMYVTLLRITCPEHNDDELAASLIVGHLEAAPGAQQ
ncbi:MAG: hypothetical protein AAF467_27750 [Actinomycetota bacterium]